MGYYKFMGNPSGALRHCHSMMCGYLQGTERGYMVESALCEVEENFKHLLDGQAIRDALNSDDEDGRGKVIARAILDIQRKLSG